MESFCDRVSAYRATPHAVTKLSPAELLHRRQIKTKLHVSGLPCMAPPKDQQNLKQIIQHSQNKIKEYTDWRRNAQSPKIQVGTFVRIRKAWQHISFQMEKFGMLCTWLRLLPASPHLIQLL